MPKKVKVIYCYCQSTDCDWAEYYLYSTGRPNECPVCGKPVGAEKPTMIDPDEIDGGIQKRVENRPSWKSGRQKEVRERSTSVGGTIYCGLCSNPIDVNGNGQEEWISKSGKPHATQPHTDHVDPWVDRKAKLFSDPNYINASDAEKKAMEREVFNASPLQTTHMVCNCSKGAS